jgi:hypothetical protein
MKVTPNMVLRFLLELTGLVAAGYWGFATFVNWGPRIAFGIGLPILMAAAWGTFRIPDDGGRPVVQVAPGIRLALEAAFFALAVFLLWAAGRNGWAIGILLVVLLNYVVDHERTLPMLANRQPPRRV